MKGLFKEIKQELIILAGLFIALCLIFKIIYFEEAIITIVRTAFAAFWLFVIPGYAFMLKWKDQLGLAERLVMGSALGAGLTGIISYYIGLVGISMTVHWILIPLLVIAAGLALYFTHAKRDNHVKADSDANDADLKNKNEKTV